jgi:type I restriction enzyme S subunit
MSAPAGYTQTALGPLPQDWRVVSLSELGQPKIGLTYKPTDVQEHGTLVLRSSNVKDGRLCFEDKVFVDPKIATTALVEQGDILICVRNGSRALIGKCAQIDRQAEGMAFGAFMSVFRTPFSEFVFRQFQSDGMKRQIEQHLGATINQITNASLKSFKIPFSDSVEERDAVVSALRDIDDLIASLDALTAKKRDIQQATMQQLLTGTTRLPGFNGKWREDRLSSIAAIPPQNGVFNEVIRKGYGSKLINVKDLYVEGPVTSDQLESFGATKGEINRFGVEDGDLFFTRSSLTPDGIAHCNLFKKTSAEEVVFDCHIIRVRIDSQKADAFFIEKFSKINRSREYFIKSAKSTTMTTIDQHVISNLPLLLPPLREQREISAIIQSMELEIAALSAKSSKIRVIKTGMMQQLLTGRIRLS